MPAAAPPAAPLAEDDASVAVARVNQGADHDATTATAVPLDATAALDLPAPPSPAVTAAATGRAALNTPRRPVAAADRAPRIGRLVVLAALAAVVLAAAITVPGLFSALISASPASLPVAVASPSASASCPGQCVTLASASRRAWLPPHPPTRPAWALDTLVGAISAAKGGPDGLKGKDANDLEAAARVRRALDAGDRRAALDAREAGQADPRPRQGWSLAPGGVGQPGPGARRMMAARPDGGAPMTTEGPADVLRPLRRTRQIREFEPTPLDPR